jgi:hypothetical protein
MNKSSQEVFVPLLSAFNLLSSGTKLIRQVFIFILLISSVPLYLNAQIIPERQWPGYRGYMSSGVLDNANLPETFSIEKSINIKWKVTVPGLGISNDICLTAPSITDGMIFFRTQKFIIAVGSQASR